MDTPDDPLVASTGWMAGDVPQILVDEVVDFYFIRFGVSAR
jgi:hypothetical protein